MTDPPLGPADLEPLRAVRHRFGGAAAARKLALLEQCGRRRLQDVRVVRAYHDLLLFLEAHADGPDHRRLVAEQLGRVADAATRLFRTSRGATLENTGIAGTDVVAAYTIDLTRWLLDRFPGDVEIAWQDGSAGTPLDDLLPACIASVERDGLLDGDVTTEQWVRLARGPGAGSDLGWLLRILERLRCPPRLLDGLFDQLELYVRLQLRERPASATFARFPPRPLHDHARPLRRSVALRPIVERPLPAPRSLSATDRRTLIDAARMALAARQRETDALTYANERETSLFSLDDGIDVAIFGMAPERRLPIESFFGYVVARNRVPMGYGGAWIFLDRAEIGVNVFEPFRGGESARLFAEVMRVYRGHFGVRSFLVDPFQLGAGNSEGIRSGAFWFYYRLGFRPLDAKLASLAASQWSRLRADRGYRSPPGVLRTLAHAPLGWSADGRSSRHGPGPDLRRLALSVTRMIGERFDGDREQAERRCGREVTRWLELDTRGWTPSCRGWLLRMSPLVTLMPQCRSWSTRDRRALAAVLRAKGGPRERDYALRLQRHAAARAALETLAASTHDDGRAS